MRAKTFVKKHGKTLIGRMVETEAIGDWPGGQAKVTDVHTNRDYILMSVESEQHGTMGIFAHEEIDFVKGTK